MFLTRLRAGAIVLLASCTMASLTTLATERAQSDRDNGRPVVAVVSGDPAPPQDPAATDSAKAAKPLAAGSVGVVPREGRIFTPDGKLVYVIVYSTDPDADQNFLHNYITVSMLPEIERVRGVGTATILGNRGYAIRIQLNPDQMRAHNLSSEDIKDAFRGCSLIGSPEQFATKAGQSKEYELTHIGRYNKPGQYENIVLKATPDGDILRLKDVGRVELESSFFDTSLDIDGYPAAAIVLKGTPGSNAADVIEAVKEKLKHIKKKSFPPGMEFQVVAPNSREMVYAVIETPRRSTLEYTSAKCHELSAIARDIDGITSVASLAGYQIRTEDRDSNAGTCLIHLKDRSDRKLTSHQIIETLEKKCRTVIAHIEFFEPPAVSVFVAAGGFSVRVLDKTSSNHDEPRGRVLETFMDELLKRKNLETLFHFFASNYPQYELVTNNDVAMQKGVSIADAIESRFKLVGSDAQAEPKLQRLVEDFSHSSFKNDRGEMVPYSSFMQLKMKRALNEIDR
jgi:multidrug efflux pump subunit AcrB